MNRLGDMAGKRIAVYSGSFNPLHIGHLAIIKYLADGDRYDAVYLIVSPKNPLKDSIDSHTGAQRYIAAQKAVNRHFTSVSDVAECGDDMPPPARGRERLSKWSCGPLQRAATEGRAGVIGTSATSETAVKVVVDDIELNMPEPHYTIRTLDALREREPSDEFTFIMGADSLADIRRWKDYKRILSEYGVAVYPREGHNLAEIRQDLLEEDPEYKIDLLDAPKVTVSSSEIRDALSKGQDISHLLM